MKDIYKHTKIQHRRRKNIKPNIKGGKEDTMQVIMEQKKILGDKVEQNQRNFLWMQKGKAQGNDNEKVCKNKFKVFKNKQHK